MEEGRLGSGGPIMVSRFNPRRSNRVLPRFSATDTRVYDYCMVERNAAIFNDDKVPYNAAFRNRDKEPGSTSAHPRTIGGNAAIFCDDKASGHAESQTVQQIGGDEKRIGEHSSFLLQRQAPTYQSRRTPNEITFHAR